MSSNAEKHVVDAAIDKAQKSLKRYSFERLNSMQPSWLKSILQESLSWIPIFLRRKRWNAEEDKQVLMERIGLPPELVAQHKDLKSAIDQYARSSCYNLFYYRRKAIRQKVLRYAYSTLTTLLVTLIPAFGFLYTDKAMGGLLPEGYNWLMDDAPEPTKDFVPALLNRKRRTGENNAKKGSHIDRVVYYDAQTPSEFVHTTAHFRVPQQGDTSEVPGGPSITDPTISVPDPRTTINIPPPRSSQPTNIPPRQTLPQENPREENYIRDTVVRIDTFVHTVTKNVPVQGANSPMRRASSGDNIGGLGALGILSSIALISALLLHNLFSQLSSKRKFAAHFQRAQSDLMNMHFQLENTLRSANTGNSQDFDHGALTTALNQASAKCNMRVHQETREFYELSAQPVVGIGAMFRSTANAASGFFHVFNRKKYATQIELLREELMNSIDAVFDANKQRTQVNLLLQIELKKRTHLEKKVQQLENELSALESSKTTDTQEGRSILQLQHRLLTAHEVLDGIVNRIELLELEKDVLDSHEA